MTPVPPGLIGVCSDGLGVITLDPGRCVWSQKRPVRVRGGSIRSESIDKTPSLITLRYGGGCLYTCRQSYFHILPHYKYDNTPTTVISESPSG